jgi:hypothetical protein
LTELKLILQVLHLDKFFALMVQSLFHIREMLVQLVRPALQEPLALQAQQELRVQLASTERQVLLVLLLLFCVEHGIAENLM